MNIKLKITKDNFLVTVVFIQFLLISVGGYFIYVNYDWNNSQSKNIKQLNTNSQIISDSINNKIKSVESTLNRQINELSVSTDKEASQLDEKISAINNSLTQKINSIPEGPPGPRGYQGPRGIQGPAGTLSNTDRATISTVKEVLGGSGFFTTRWRSYWNRDLIEIDECLDAIKSYITSYYKSSSSVSNKC